MKNRDHESNGKESSQGENKQGSGQGQPTFRLERSKTEIAEVAVHETVEVQARSLEEAIDAAREGEGEVMASKEGHTEYTGETKGTPEVKAA